MNIKSVSAALALALLSTTAMAADLPSRRAPPVYVPPPIPAFTWTGFYIGAHAGYEFGKSNALAVGNGTGAALIGNSANENGIVGGAHIGYLFSTQSLPFLGGFGSNLFGGGLVAGVEGDVDGTSARSAYTLGGLLNVRNDQNVQGSIRGRLGVAVDRALFYATGGAAFGGLQNSYASAIGYDSIDRTRVGYTVGGGVEYAFTNNISARVEYRYTDFGNYQNDLLNSAAGLVSVRQRATDNRVMGGISYHFNTFTAPVVARY